MQVQLYDYDNDPPSTPNVWSVFGAGGGGVAVGRGGSRGVGMYSSPPRVTATSDFLGEKAESFAGSSAASILQPTEGADTFVYTSGRVGDVGGARGARTKDPLRAYAGMDSKSIMGGRRFVIDPATGQRIVP